MKKCPQCGREYDLSMSFCLDDGAELLYGPAANTEPQTAIFHETAAPNEAATRAQIHTTTGQTTVLDRPQDRSRFRRLVAVSLLIAMVGLGALVGYRYFRSGASGQITSIAVLPFQNRSGDADSEYLSDGLAESLIYRLSQIPELKVSPRSSVFRYKGQEVDAEKVGNELAVDAVMSGRLVQRGDTLTISVDLVDVRNKKTLWGEQFERKMSDLLATQTDIASAIVAKLQLKLAGGDPKAITQQGTTNNESYQLYLQGRYFWNKRSSGNLKKAVEVLKAATEKDPKFALAYTALADCYAVSYYYVGERPREILPLARVNALKALELDPTLAEPHTTLGFVAMLLDWNKVEAEKEFRRAIEINPNYPTAHHWYSRFLRGVGRYEEAWREINRAKELEPLSIIFINNVCEMQIDRGELDAAEQTARQAIELDPEFWAAHNTLSIILIKQGRLDEALVSGQKSLDVSGRANAPLAVLGHIHGLRGEREKAEAIIRELEQRKASGAADARDVAIAYVGLKEHDKAFEWLEKAYSERGIFMAFLNLEPLFAPLHADPRWRDLKRRVGLSD